MIHLRGFFWGHPWATRGLAMSAMAALVVVAFQNCGSPVGFDVSVPAGSSGSSGSGSSASSSTGSSTSSQTSTGSQLPTSGSVLPGTGSQLPSLGGSSTSPAAPISPTSPTAPIAPMNPGFPSSPVEPTPVCSYPGGKISSPDGKRSCTFGSLTLEVGQERRDILSTEGTGRLHYVRCVATTGKPEFEYSGTCPNLSGTTCPFGRQVRVAVDYQNICVGAWGLASPGQSLQLVESVGGLRLTASCKPDLGWENVRYLCPNRSGLVACEGGMESIPSQSQPGKFCTFQWNPVLAGGQVNVTSTLEGGGPRILGGSLRATCGQNGQYENIVASCP